jgi:hypothetical protein
MRGRMEKLQAETDKLEERMAEEIENVKRSFRAELVPYKPNPFDRQR